jgi:hypothetical protein
VNVSNKHLQETKFPYAFHLSYTSNKSKSSLLRYSSPRTEKVHKWLGWKNELVGYTEVFANQYCKNQIYITQKMNHNAAAKLHLHSADIHENGVHENWSGKLYHGHVW